jgi:hypothetical protein
MGIFKALWVARQQGWVERGVAISDVIKTILRGNAAQLLFENRFG